MAEEVVIFCYKLKYGTDTFLLNVFFIDYTGRFKISLKKDFFKFIGEPKKFNTTVGGKNYIIIPILIENNEHLEILSSQIVYNSKDLKNNITIENIQEVNKDNIYNSQYRLAFINEKTFNEEKVEVTEYNNFKSPQDYNSELRSFSKNNDLLQFIRLKETDYNKPKINEIIEVFNPEVSGINHINIIKRTMELTF